MHRFRVAVPIPSHTDQRGSGTLLIIGMIVLLVVGLGAFGIVGRYLIARQSAQSAADLAALAGAQTYGAGGDGCRAAEASAERNGHRLADCSVVGSDVDFVLTATIVAPVDVGTSTLPDSVRVQAYAGPVR